MRSIHLAKSFSSSVVIALFRKGKTKSLWRILILLQGQKNTNYFRRRVNRPIIAGLVRQNLILNSQADKHLIQLLATEPDRAIELIFREYYSFVCRKIIRVVHEDTLAEDIAQEVFLEVWKKRESLVVNSTLKAYLGRAGVNRALNYLRNQRPELFIEDELPESGGHFEDALQKLEADDLQERIDMAIAGLPERCRLVFSLSRFEEMSNKEVAAELGISEKTVENQMTKALRMLREALDSYLK
jgi:RNA polymerase sigma-70 factor (ECF subfamily)